MFSSWYALRSYNHHCFFSQINKSKKRKDSLAFFVFFTFKGRSAVDLAVFAAVQARVAWAAVWKDVVPG